MLHCLATWASALAAEPCGFQARLSDVVYAEVVHNPAISLIDDSLKSELYSFALALL